MSPRDPAGPVLRRAGRAFLLAGALLAAITPAARAAEPALPPLTGLHDQRYCELLFLRLGARGVSAQVWTTFSLNDCPARQWRALDLGRLSWQTGSLAVRNGPRHWLIDTLESAPTAPRPKRSFGGLEMLFGATIPSINPLAVRPFAIQRVDRRATFTYNAGTTVFEVTDPAGKRFVMQAYSQQYAHRLSVADLPTIGTHIGLPAGWSYAARTLTQPLVIDTMTTKATVLQDRLANTYTLEATPTA
jgi:hypothetical protein